MWSLSCVMGLYHIYIYQWGIACPACLQPFYTVAVECCKFYPAELSHGLYLDRETDGILLTCNPSQVNILLPLLSSDSVGSTPNEHTLLKCQATPAQSCHICTSSEPIVPTSSAFAASSAPTAATASSQPSPICKCCNAPCRAPVGRQGPDAEHNALECAWTGINIAPLGDRVHSTRHSHVDRNLDIP